MVVRKMEKMGTWDRRGGERSGRERRGAEGNSTFIYSALPCHEQIKDLRPQDDLQQPGFCGHCCVNW